MTNDWAKQAPIWFLRLWFVVTRVGFGACVWTLIQEPWPESLLIVALIVTTGYLIMVVTATVAISYQLWTKP